MTSTALPLRRPQQVAVVGAGVVGLSTARALLQHGIEVDVLESEHVAAGASWGNAGWLTPTLTTPLPEPSVLRYGLGALLRPSSPVYVPPRVDPRLWRFLVGFGRHCTHRQWARAMEAFGPMNRLALDAYDELVTALPHVAGLRQRVADPFLECFRTEAERDLAVRALTFSPHTPPVDHEVLSGAEVRDLEPALSSEVGGAIALQGQRYLDPPAFMRALADVVIAEGGKLVEGVEITGIDRTLDRYGRLTLRDAAGGERRYDAVVLATGAVLGRLARPYGVRRLVQAGRGYSFSVAGPHVPRVPLYFSTQRVACTPLGDPEADGGGRLRVAGMMEFRRHRAPRDPRRITAIVDAVRPLLSGVDLDDRRDEWVGSRPCTADGLPLIGMTSSSRVFVAGGHGMWGVVWGPLTGRLLAAQIATGARPDELAPFDPLR